MKKLYPKRFMFLLDEEIYQKLKKLSSIEDSSMGDVIRQLIMSAYVHASIASNEVIGGKEIDLVDDQNCRYKQNFSIGEGKAKLEGK